MGELAGGDWVIEKQLADRLQVSRTPIREALRLLERVSVSEACRHATLEQLDEIDRAITQAETAITQESHPSTTYQLLHLDYFIA